MVAAPNRGVWLGRDRQANGFTRTTHVGSTSVILDCAPHPPVVFARRLEMRSPEPARGDTVRLGMGWDGMGWGNDLLLSSTVSSWASRRATVQYSPVQFSSVQFSQIITTTTTTTSTSEEVHPREGFTVRGPGRWGGAREASRPVVYWFCAFVLVLYGTIPS
jgi:hypothetical protein